MRCSSCGHDNTSNALFCERCATPLRPACLECGAVLSPNAQFCPQCAHAVDAGGTSARSSAVNDAEWRQLTVMFCDLVDSTELSKRLDAERLREVVRAYHETAVGAVEHYDGHVAQYLGDGLLAYFGYPRAHEDDAVRAVTAALEIVTALPALNVRLQERLLLEHPGLRVRIGIHTGPVVVGEIGSGETRERLAIGDTVNIAARLQSEADPDQVVISDATQTLVEGVFLLDELGGRSLKGIDEPVQLHQVIAATGLSSRLELGAARGLAPFVGREHELSLLVDRFEQVGEAGGQVVLLSGDAGIGKSRLISMLQERLGTGARWLELRASPHHQNSALYPAIRVLRDSLEFRPETTGPLATLEQELERADVEVSQALPLLASILSIPSDGLYAPANLTPVQLRQLTLEALASWLLGASDPKPLILVVEDLHWLDSTTLELVALLIEQAPSAGVLVLATFRPSFQPPWPSRAHVLLLTLNSLSRAQARGLAQSIAGTQPLPTRVLEKVVERANGVPLFVEEFSKAIRGSDDPSAIPATLQDSLMARLDRLGSAKETAQLGSVLGAEFAYELLREVSLLDEELLRRDLHGLEDAEILFRRGFPPNAIYRFKHRLLQEAAEQSLLRSRRRELHERTARALERQLLSERPAHPEVLAQHFADAGLAEPAVAYFKQAGEQALERCFGWDEAAVHLTEGLRLSKQLSDGREHRQLERALQLNLGHVMQILRGHGAPEVERAFTRARELSEDADEARELFPALWGLWLNNHQRGDLAPSCRLSEQILRLAETNPEPDLLLQAHHAAWMTQQTVGQLASALEHTQAGLAIYRPEEHHALMAQFGNHDAGVCALAYAGWVLALQGFPEQSRTRIRQCLELADSFGHPFTSVVGRLHSLFAALTLRDAPAADEHVAALGAVVAEMGGVSTTFKPLFDWMEGHVRYHRGEDGAIARMREGLDDMVIEPSRFPFALVSVCDAYAADGQPDEGIELLDRFRSQIDAIGSTFNDAELVRVKGELLRKQSLKVQAEAAFRQALAIAHGQQANLLELRSALGLGRLLETSGRITEARELVSDLYSWFSEGLDATDIREARIFLDQLG